MGPDPTGGPPGLSGAGEDPVMHGEFQPTTGSDPLADRHSSKARTIISQQSGALNPLMTDRDG